MKHLQKIIEASEAFFFDLDGTLVFTSDLHDLAYKQACKKLNIPYKNLQFPVSPEIYEIKKKIYFELLTIENLKLNKEVYEIFLNVSSKNKKTAIVTNTLRQNADKILEKLEIKPDIIVSGEDFKRIKPHPDMYESTIKRMKVPKNKILVFEDSKIGIQSAISANLKVIDVRNGKIYE